ncbi:hypothetical protein C1I97_08025 [Streptomyces sp. NTH33]|uniref:hypothetical protein n=1 Tax=Streptomyces sp. NTH33 TaxID=1735453 RepID=UPI000DA76CBA|nr:hypothetical protein [Streptomyces sp. NTH33]PZH15587.1 hypothetical protein C1I97_08025 [Streptomyces sp. NTH33]
MTHHLRRQLLWVLLAVAVGAVDAWSIAGRLREPAAVLTVAFLLLLAAATRAGRSHRRLLTVRAIRTAGVPENGSPTARAWQDLYEACCLPAWESHGTIHDPRICTGRAAA